MKHVKGLAIVPLLNLWKQLNQLFKVRRLEAIKEIVFELSQRVYIVRWPLKKQNEQMNRRSIKNLLAQMPINARVGYGIRCLERAFSHMNCPPNHYLLEAFKSFTTYDNVLRSISLMSDILPTSILEDIPFDEKSMEAIDNKTHDEFAIYYKGCPSQIREIIELVYHIAFDDLNVGIVYPSKDTLNSVMKVVRILQRNNIDLPDVREFTVFKFDQGSGRGAPFVME